MNYLSKAWHAVKRTAVAGLAAIVITACAGAPKIDQPEPEPKDKVAISYFYNPDCEACERPTEIIEALKQKYADKVDVELYCVKMKGSDVCSGDYGTANAYYHRLQFGGQTIPEIILVKGDNVYAVGASPGLLCVMIDEPASCLDGLVSLDYDYVSLEENRK